MKSPCEKGLIFRARVNVYPTEAGFVEKREVRLMKSLSCDCKACTWELEMLHDEIGELGCDVPLNFGKLEDQLLYKLKVYTSADEYGHVDDIEFDFIEHGR